MSRLVLILLFAFLGFGSAEEPQAQTVLSASADSLHLEALVTFQRHGASTPKYATITKDEYSLFGMDSEAFNSLTPVGMAQMWSAGRTLFKRHQAFFEKIDLKKQMSVVLGGLDKSLEGSELLLSGLLELRPSEELGLTSLTSEAKQLVKQKGNCPFCQEENRFPQEFLEELEEDSMSIAMNQADTSVDLPGETLVKSGSLDMSQVKVLNYEDEWLIDTDNNCKYLKFLKGDITLYLDKENYYREIIDNKNLKQVFQEYLENLYYNEQTDLEPSDFVNIRLYFYETLYRHFASGLSEAIVHPALLSIFSEEKYAESYIFEYKYVQFQNKMMTRIFASELLRRSLDFFEHLHVSGEQFRVFFVHDNNIASILATLMGYEEFEANFMEYLPRFASSIQFELFKRQETQEEFVKVRWNGEYLKIQGCDDADCPLATFEEILKKNIVTNLKDFCLTGMDQQPELSEINE